MLCAAPAAAQEIDPLDPPREAVQLAWRMADGQVGLQYTYTAPNGCWSAGEVHVDNQVSDGVGNIAIVPEVSGGFCTQALTPLDYSGSYAIPAEANVLTVSVIHPLGGLIEENQLWINPDGYTD